LSSLSFLSTSQFLSHHVFPLFRKKNKKSERSSKKKNLFGMAKYQTKHAMTLLCYGSEWAFDWRVFFRCPFFCLQVRISNYLQVSWKHFCFFSEERKWRNHTRKATKIEDKRWQNEIMKLHYTRWWHCRRFYGGRKENIQFPLVSMWISNHVAVQHKLPHSWTRSRTTRDLCGELIINSILPFTHTHMSWPEAFPPLLW
jgi:hypothetical protein